MRSREALAQYGLEKFLRVRVEDIYVYMHFFFPLELCEEKCYV